MKRLLLLVSALLLALWLTPVQAGEATGIYRVVGLGTPDRQDLLRELVKTIPEVQIESLDYEKAQATVRYDVTTLFPGFNPKKPPTADDINKRLDEKVRQASLGGFSFKPLSTLPPDQMQKLEITIRIPDCSGCRLGTYYVIARTDGVEQVNLSADFSQLIVWIDPAKTNRDTLVEMLKKARVGFPPEAAATTAKP